MRSKILLILLFLGLAAPGVQASPASDLAAQFLNYLENYYVEPEKLELAKIRARLNETLTTECADDTNCPSSKLHAELNMIAKALPDKTSRFLSPEEAAQKRLEAKGDNLNDARFGLGLELKKNLVYRVLENSPADKAGVLVGDIVTSVSRNNQTWGKELKFLDNTPVLFELERRGVKLEKSMSPELGWLTNLLFPEMRLQKPKIAYIRIPSFRLQGTAARVHDLLAKQAGLESVILDLRFNTGGLLEEMLLTLSAFFEGDAIRLRAREVSQLYSLKNGGIETKVAGKTTRFALEHPTRFKGTLIVLTNAKTASAAELFALILQRQEAARFIGESSYGLCQTALAPLQLLDQSELRLAAVKNLFSDSQSMPVKLEPDYAMLDDLKALSEGHDLILETATKWLEPVGLNNLFGLRLF